MKNFRDIENLSAYLDGQLKDSDAARLEARLKSDPELDSVLRDLRATRGILRKLPARKAPRNFTLTRQMVGLKPPVPRTYPLFRLATVFATLLFVMSLSVNMLSPYVSFTNIPSPAFGYGGGGGGCEEPCEPPSAVAQDSAPMEESAAATEAPAATEEAFAAEMAPPNATEDTADSADGAATKSSEPPASDELPESAPQPEVQNEAPFSNAWVVGSLIVAVLGAAIMWFMQSAARKKWRQ